MDDMPQFMGQHRYVVQYGCAMPRDKGMDIIGPPGHGDAGFAYIVGQIDSTITEGRGNDLGLSYSLPQRRECGLNLLLGLSESV